MNRYPHLLTTIILSGILIPPFLLKMLASSLEPYPAIVLPAGAHQVKLTDTQVNFSRTSIWGKDLATDSWTRIDSEQLLDPIPNEYLGHMVYNSFGLEAPNKDVSGKLQQIFVSILRGKITPEEVEASKQWLSKRLTEQNCAPDRFKVTEQEVVFDVSTGKIASSKIKDERVFRLD